MINSFQPLNTITSGLILQQLEQEINANNLAQPSFDSQGYLMNSLEQVNSTSAPSISFTGENGLLSIGTGTDVASITRLRSSYLDSQIQNQSMLTGYNEILSNTNLTGAMQQINTIVNGTTNLNSQLTAFATAWGTLASSPTNVADQVALVNAGVAFASEANNEYNQLQTLQLQMNTQVSQTVDTINGLTQQLASINQQLVQTSGTNQDSLLDARDYALDKLSRLINYNVTYGNDGVANVWLNDLNLVSGNTASTLQTFTESVNNSQLTGITIAENGGTFSDKKTTTGVVTPVDLTSLITGGNLGGELYARNTLIQSYKAQIDQVATSVINATNNIYQAGYIANSGTASTGTAFFTGTGAASIQVNNVLTNLANSSPATSFIATQYVANSASTTNNLATFLSNLPNIYAGGYVASKAKINKSVPPTLIDPTTSMFGQNFLTTPAPPGAQSFTVNSVTVNFTNAAGGSSINDILNQINSASASSGVYAVFNYNTQQFYIYGTSAITINDGVGDQLANWTLGFNYLASTIVMNNSTNPNTDFGSPLDSTIASAFDVGPNSQALLVTPSASGTFKLSDALGSKTISWSNSETLAQLKTAIQGAGLGITFTPAGNGNGILLSTAFASGPLTLTDLSGNFGTFTGLNSNSTIGNISVGILTTATTQSTTFQTANATASASLTQLNNEQGDLAGVNSGGSGPGVPIASIQQQAMQSMITYNAMLQVMEVIDQMLDALVGISSTSTTSGIFAQKS